MVLNASGQRLALQVDDVMQEQEVLVKSLGRQLTRVRHFSGAVVLGSGRVVPVLHITDVIQTAAQWRKRGTRPEATPEVRERSRKHILVAEDSITSRTLIKNILETAGYEVETTVDGMDAWSRLHLDTFDLVVSDVDMPRMNGFGLTTRIRNDQKLQELPVVLVTSLDSREDRERGIEVGASAYIVKSSFDQSNLLDVVERLI